MPALKFKTCKSNKVWARYEIELQGDSMEEMLGLRDLKALPGIATAFGVPEAVHKAR
jgi:hypothetical protein